MTNEAQGIDEIPEFRVEHVRLIGDGRSLTLSVKLGKHSDNVGFVDVFEAVGIVTSYNKLIGCNLYYSVKHVSAGRESVENDVVFFKLRVGSFEYNHITVGLKQGTHAYATGNRGVHAVF